MNRIWAEGNVPKKVRVFWRSLRKIWDIDPEVYECTESEWEEKLKDEDLVLSPLVDWKTTGRKFGVLFGFERRETMDSFLKGEPTPIAPVIYFYEIRHEKLHYWEKRIADLLEERKDDIDADLLGGLFPER